AVVFGWLAYYHRSNLRPATERQSQLTQTQKRHSLEHGAQKPPHETAAPQLSNSKSPGQPSRFTVDKELADRLESEREEMEERMKRRDEPDAALEFFRLKRAPIGERAVPTERYLTAREKMRQMPQFSTAQERSMSAPEEEGVQLSQP